MSRPGINEIKVQLGSQTTVSTIETVLQKADSFTAVLINDAVYHDSRVVRIAVQAKDALFNPPAVWRTIKCVAIASLELISIEDVIVKAQCTQPSRGKETTGVCVLQLYARQKWFEGTIDPQQRTMALACGFADESLSTWNQLGTVTLHPGPTFTPGQNIVVVLPSKPVFPGMTLSVPVYASFNHLLETFTIDFGVDASLMRIKGFELARGGKWSGTTANTGSIATLSYFRDTSGLSKKSGCVHPVPVVFFLLKYQFSCHTPGKRCQLSITMYFYRSEYPFPCLLYSFNRFVRPGCMTLPPYVAGKQRNSSQRCRCRFSAVVLHHHSGPCLWVGMARATCLTRQLRQMIPVSSLDEALRPPQAQTLFTLKRTCVAVCLEPACLLLW